MDQIQSKFKFTISTINNINNNINNNNKSNSIYFNREILCFSKEKRRVDLITISSFDGIINTREPLAKNYIYENGEKLNKRSFQFSKEKPVIFISCRVHPGETPASFLMNGIIRFLINEKDPRAEILRKAFLFKIVPIINVDGVSRGYYRYDTNSLNMNRHYINPDKKTQPEIYAIKRIFIYYSQKSKIKFYFDLHAHASSKGLFLFGNNLEYLQQIENCVLPKIMEINCEYLNFLNCNFSERSMRTKERGDKYSKEGTGRVYFHKSCDIIHCYTVEASYFRGIYKGNLPKELDLFKENFNPNLITSYNKDNLNSNINSNFK